MNLDKKLARYARQLDNPKYFPKILDILDKADKTNYQFKDFNLYDLDHVASEIKAYYDAIQTPEEDARMIKYCNNFWFIISDKNYILYETPNLLWALEVYFKSYLFLFIARVRQLFYQDRLITTDNVNKDVWLIRGAIKASKFLDCTIFELDEYKVIN